MPKDYLAMVKESPDDAEHHGVKGMKWGVRKEVDAVARTDLAKNGIGRFGLSEVQAKTNKAVSAKEGVNQKDLRNASTAALQLRKQVLNKKDGPFSKNGSIDSINKAWNDKGMNPNADAATRAKYDAEVVGKLNEYIKDKAPEGTTAQFLAAAGDYHLFVGNNPQQVSDMMAEVKKNVDALQHDDMGPSHMKFKAVRDDKGFITDLEPDDMQHHGIKGMKWGVRKGEGAPTAEAHALSKPKAGETTQERYARLQQDVKNHGASKLSDDDLRFMGARADAIKKVEKLNSSNPNWLADATNQVLKQAAKQAMSAVVAAAVGKHVSGPLTAAIKNAGK